MEILSLKYRVQNFRKRLGCDDIISVLQQNRLQWYGHVLQKEDNDRVTNCMEYLVEDARPRYRPKKTWTEICKKTVRHVNCTGRMSWIIVDGGSR